MPPRHDEPPALTGGSMARFAAKMASCYPSDPARCALNDAVFEMAQVEDGGGRWWFRVVVNPGENAAEGRCVDLELVNVHCFLDFG